MVLERGAPGRAFAPLDRGLDPRQLRAAVGLGHLDLDGLDLVDGEATRVEVVGEGLDRAARVRRARHEGVGSGLRDAPRELHALRGNLHAALGRPDARRRRIRAVRRQRGDRRHPAEWQCRRGHGGLPGSPGGQASRIVGGTDR